MGRAKYFEVDHNVLKSIQALDSIIKIYPSVQPSAARHCQAIHIQIDIHIDIDIHRRSNTSRSMSPHARCSLCLRFFTCSFA